MTEPRTRERLRSFRGESGLWVGALVVLAALLVEAVVTRPAAPPRQLLRALGLAVPSALALRLALVLAAALVLVIPLYALLTGVAVHLRPDSWWLVPGLLAQGGVAEELVFRGYLFRHLRARATFWGAAALAAVPFVLVHLTLFRTLELPIAASSLLVALSLTFPLSWLYERAGNSLWPGAILHCTIQGAIKLVVTRDEDFLGLALTWMAISALAPWLVFTRLLEDDKVRGAHSI